MTAPMQRVGLHFLLLVLLAACALCPGTRAQEKAVREQAKQEEVAAKVRMARQEEEAKRKLDMEREMAWRVLILQEAAKQQEKEVVAKEKKQEKKKEAAPKPKVVRAPIRARVVRQQWTDENFDQWVFQQERNSAAGRQRLETRLALQLEFIDSACRLTDAQKKKLQLAGRGDIKRFFDRYETVKQKFQLVKEVSQEDQQKFQDVWQKVWQDISPLQTSLQAGLFHDDSLVYKSLYHTLTPEQWTRYEAVARERREFRHRAAIELMVASFEQTVPLRDAQRRDLITLLISQTKPLRKSSQYDSYLLLFQLSQIPQEKLKPLFDARQWKVIEWNLTQAKNVVRSLKQSGQLPDENDQADESDVRPDAVKN
jgi:hypothetical protein